MKKMWVLVLLIPLVLTLCVTARAAQPTTPVEITPTYDWYSYYKNDDSVTTYTIKTVEDLAGLAKLTQGKVEGVTTAAIDFSNEKPIVLGNNLTFGDDQYWYYNNGGGTVYDYRIMNFAGTFDGNEKTIANLKFYKQQSGTFSMGLFNSITADGSVKDLTLSNVSAVTYGGWGSQTSIGPLANSLYGTVDNCHVDGVNYTVNGYLNYSGGMFSNIYNDAVVTNSTVTDLTIITAEGVTDSGQHVGGFVGNIGRSGNNTTSVSTISNCSVTTVTIDCTEKTKRFGGFVGAASNTNMTDCTATTVNISIDNYYYTTGGFIGIAYGNSTYTRCKVVGFTMNGSSADLQNGQAPYVTGDVGGFVGQTSGNPISFHECTVTGLDMNLEIEKSDGGCGVGGFIGWLSGSSITIDDCSVSGEITATGEGMKDPAGGFIGVANTSNNITLDDCTTDAAIDTTGIAGGLIGYIKNTDNELTFENCTPTTSLVGDVVKEVANHPTKEYTYNSGDKTVSAVPYLCYVLVDGFKIGYPSLQAAVDDGETGVTLYADMALTAPAKKGYQLGTWYDSSGSAVTAGAAEQTYYAKWNDEAAYTAEPDTLDFGTVVYGDTPTAKSITFVTNDSVPAIESVTGSESFHAALSGLSVEVTPKEGLTVGTYTEKISVEVYKGDVKERIEIPVIIEIEPVIYTAEPSELDFGTVVYGDTPTAKSITFVTNDTAPTITPVTESAYFDVEDGAGRTNMTLTIKPKAGLTVGTYSEDIAVKVGNGETVSIPVTIKVKPATLTATYKGETVKLGWKPELKVEITGFVNGETEEVLTAMPTLSGDYNVLRVGEYTLTPTGGAADNYVFAYEAGTLKILRRNSNGGSGGLGGDSGTLVESPKTFDAGIALYAGMALTSAMGAAYVMKKK